MRFISCSLLILLSTALFSQEKNSLLWEISGNGLQQNSYLYGTMHVSKKIAFRLDDVFYEALDKSEVVALESNPETWLDDADQFQAYAYSQGGNVKGFYTNSFAVRNPRKEDIGAYLAFEDQMINNILYRTNEFSQNFEEETYLDMFIYQAGKKFQKPIVALEDLEESTALVGRASLNATKQKPDEWLQKKMQQQDPLFLMQDAYRERNISLLDSLDQAMYTEHYLKNMLYIRNANMVQQLDSLMHKSKVFTGIGAAHLPGKKGVIAMLRAKGYTVKPLRSKATAKGKRLKEKFETKIRANTYSVKSPDDAFFSVSLPNKLYPISEFISTSYISPDLANGSYVMISRIPTFSFLKQDAIFNLDDVDGLLFENIPGKILEKTRIQTGEFSGIDIKNKLKNGDHQRYHIYKTPLEILIFKMAGEGDYVVQHSDTIFNSIAFKTLTNTNVTLSSAYDDFEIQMPSLHTFTNKKRNGKRYVEGYDKNSDSYYFLRKASLNDLTFIEEDTFELKHIQKRFYQDLKLEGNYKEPQNSTLSSFAVIDTVKHEKLHLKTVLRGSEYYLLGVKTKQSEAADTFFNSFKLKKAKYLEAFKTVHDTAMFFTTVTAVKPPKFVDNSRGNYNRRNTYKDYNAYNKKTIYRNQNDEQITVILNKAHDYLMFPSLDSVWTLRKKIYAGKRFNIHKETRKTAPEGYHELQFTLLDTASTRGVLIKNIIKGGLLYEVKTVIDTLYQPSKFIRSFYDHFKPTDTLVGKDIVDDKTAAFFAALRANDSIVLEGHQLINFEKKHIDSLKYYISEFDFKDNQLDIQSHLIRQLGQLKTADVSDFLADFYGKSYSNGYAQTKILQSITKKQDEESVQLLLALMRKDLPLTSEKFETYMLLEPYTDSLPLAKKLYPEILEYSSIDEFKSPIFSLLSQLKAEGLVKPNTYRKYRKQLLNDAKIQLKRQLGKNTNGRRGQRRFSDNLSPGTNLLEDYVILLYPFRKEKGAKTFFTRLSEYKNPIIQTTYMALLAENDVPIPQSTLDSLAADINSRNLLYSKLQKNKKLSLFPAKYNTAKAIAEASIYRRNNYDAKQDSIFFLTKKQLVFRGEKFTGYYFKTKDHQAYNTHFKMHLVVFENGKPLTVKPYYKNNGFRMQDTDTDDEVIDMVTEGFLLKDRKRAKVYRPNQYGAYNYYGY